MSDNENNFKDIAESLNKPPVNIVINNTQQQIGPNPSTTSYYNGESITLSRIAGYVVGGFCFMAAFGMLLQKNILSALLVVCAATMVFPPAYAGFSKKFNIHFSYWARVGLFFTFLFLMGLADK